MLSAWMRQRLLERKRPSLPQRPATRRQCPSQQLWPKRKSGLWAEVVQKCLRHRRQSQQSPPHLQRYSRQRTGAVLYPGGQVQRARGRGQNRVRLRRYILAMAVKAAGASGGSFLRFRPRRLLISVSLVGTISSSARGRGQRWDQGRRASRRESRAATNSSIHPSSILLFVIFYSFGVVCLFV